MEPDVLGIIYTHILENFELKKNTTQQAKVKSKGVWRTEETVLDSWVICDEFMVDFEVQGGGSGAPMHPQ